MTAVAAPRSLFSRAMGIAKRTIGPIISNDFTGTIAARLLSDRIPHRGLTIDTSDPVVSPRIKAALLLRGYESGEYRFVRKYLPRDTDVLELGGSLGVISCTIRRHIAPDRRLVIVEADPRLARALQRNLLLNDCTAGTRIEQVAIAYGAGETVQFSLGETSVSGRIAPAGSGLATLDVPAVTLAGLIETHGLDDFCLVSDVEGVEWWMVRHDLASLARARMIVMETHDNPEFGTYEALITELTASGLFRLVDRHGCVIVLERSTAHGGKI